MNKSLLGSGAPITFLMFLAFPDTVFLFATLCAALLFVSCDKQGFQIPLFLYPLWYESLCY